MKRNLLIFFVLCMAAVMFFAGMISCESTYAQTVIGSTGDNTLLEAMNPHEPGRVSIKVDKTLKRKSSQKVDKTLKLKSSQQKVMLKKGDAEFSSTGVQKATGNRVRKVPSKPAHTKITPYVKSNLITVKFVEGSEIRLRKGGMTSMTKADMSMLDSFNANFPKGKWKRLFRQSEDELKKAKKHGEERTGWQLADLNLYFRFELPEEACDNSGGVKDAEAIIDVLNAMDIVEIAYPEPIPEDPGPVGDIPPAMPDYTGQQGYLGPAPAGLDAEYSWQFDGGAGYGSSFIDIERGWDVCHEDLNVDSSDVLAGFNMEKDHGTAVLGEVIGSNNGYGVTGIAHQANAQMVSYKNHGDHPDISAAIYTAAAANLSPGDIILI